MKILLLRFSAIGDIVLTSAVVRCLKAQIGAEVHFCTKDVYRDLVAQNPNIDKVHTLDGSLFELLLRLRKENYDLVLDLHDNLRSRLVRWALMRPTKVYDKASKAKAKYVKDKISPNFPHVTLRYMATLAGQGVKYDGMGLDFHSTVDFETLAERYGVSQYQYTVLVVGASKTTKMRTIESLAKLCAKIEGPLLLLGGKGDMARAAELKSHLPHLIDTCGQISLAESAKMIEHCAYVYTHDTGLMHIAAAFHKPMTVLWCATTPALGFGPLMPDHLQASIIHLEQLGLSCRPCHRFGLDACPERHFRCGL